MDRFDYDFDKLTNQNALYSNNVKDLFNELEDVEQTIDDSFTLDNSFEKNDTITDNKVNSIMSNINDKVYNSKSEQVFSPSINEETDNIMREIETDNIMNDIYNKTGINNIHSNIEDNMNKTQEIDFADQLIASGDLETIKALQAQMHELAEDKPEENELQNEEQGMSQEKGKVLTKSTKAGKAFANNEIANAFINCSILGFITAFIGGSMFVYILNHLG